MSKQVSAEIICCNALRELFRETRVLQQQIVDELIANGEAPTERMLCDAADEKAQQKGKRP